MKHLERCAVILPSARGPQGKQQKKENDKKGGNEAVGAEEEKHTFECTERKAVDIAMRLKENLKRNGGIRSPSGRDVDGELWVCNGYVLAWIDGYR